MSSFVVSQETLQRVVTAASACQRFDARPSRFYDGLGADLYLMNCKAVAERYGEKVTETDRETAINFRWKLSFLFPGDGPLNFDYAVQCLKSLDCFLYQCNEGDIDESQLYRDMENVCDWLRKTIISELPAYQVAKWD